MIMKFLRERERERERERCIHMNVTITIGLTANIKLVGITQDTVFYLYTYR